MMNRVMNFLEKRYIFLNKRTNEVEIEVVHIFKHQQVPRWSMRCNFPLFCQITEVWYIEKLHFQ